MRAGWIAACTLAAIGGFFILLQAVWLAKLEPQWLAYAAQPVGALLAGIAMASLVERRTHRGAMIAGVLGVGVLVVIAYALPRAFVLTAVHSSHPAVLLPALVVGCGLACTAGTHVAGIARGVGVAIAAALVAACVIQLGGRLAFVCGLPAQPAAIAAFGFVAAGIAGAVVAAASDDVYPRATIVGVLAFLVFAEVVQLSHAGASFQLWDAILLFGAPLAAGAGARIVQATAK
jgi:hypothetical protein